MPFLEVGHVLPHQQRDALVLQVDGRAVLRFEMKKADYMEALAIDVDVDVERHCC